MPGERGHGQSRNGTHAKEGAFACVLAYHLRRCESSTNIRSFFFVDLNAGSGHNDHANVTGSPLLFRRHARKCHNLSTVAWYCEKNKERFADLNRALEDKQLTLFSGPSTCEHRTMRVDNGAFLGMLPDLIKPYQPPRYAQGFIYSDPNGVNDGRGGFPLIEIGKAAREFPRFVICITYAWQSALRVLGYKRNHDADVFTIDDIFGHVNRPYWLITPSTPHGRVVLCASSDRIPGNTKYPFFYDVESHDGRKILRQVRGQK